MPDVVVYSTDYCGYCVRAKDLLQRKGVAFKEVLVDRDPEQRKIMEQRCGCRTVPQIFIGETHVGGYHQLRQMDVEGKLDALLATVNTEAR